MSNKESVDHIIGLALCLCATDGVVSEEEESEIIRLVQIEFPEIENESINKVIDCFFESDDQLEHYLDLIAGRRQQIMALSLAYRSAKSDGLDIREEIAFRKALSVYGLSEEDVTDG